MFQLTLDRNKNNLNPNLSLNAGTEIKVTFIKAVWKKKRFKMMHYANKFVLVDQNSTIESNKQYDITIIHAFERKDFGHNI